MSEDIRWKQRFDNFLRAYTSLRKAVELSRERSLTELEQQGLIQGFEFTHELAWNVLKDYLEAKGISGLIGSRDATRHGFRNGLIEDGDTWMEMIKARNLTSHAYDPEIAHRIAVDILSRYHPAFERMVMVFTELAKAVEA
jgi:nucleotidyltransferase substrate binding protein (TIGR01987 family)